MFKDSPSDLFRLAETAAPREDRLMPSQRTYATSTKTVSVEDAVALMKLRKKDPSKRIPGGLDDDAPAPVTEAEKTAGESPAATETPSRGRRGRPPKNSPSPAVSQTALDALGMRLDRLEKTLAETGAHEGANASAREKAYAKGLSELLGGRHKATFKTGGMSFTVSCLEMVKDDRSHSLVLAFPEDGDAFFEPPVQSELELEYDGRSVGGKLFYFGLCFVLKRLGLKFLGFLFDETLNASKAG